MAVTELRYREPQFLLSTPPKAEDAFLVAVHLELYERYEYWENGKAAPVSRLRPGETIIYDVKRQPTFHLSTPFHSVHFYLPTPALNAIADQADAARIQELRYRPGVAHADPVLRSMALGLLPLFRDPQNASRLFMDHLMLAVGHHVATTYGGMIAMQRPPVGGLTAYQERRVREFIAANLAADVPLATLAGECGLSPSHFARAFRQTMGIPPHKWVVQQRIAQAKALLRASRMSLVEVASACGFADQSHFTRHFSAQVGISPGQWRRVLRT